MAITIINDIEHLPFGTHVTIKVGKAQYIQAVSFGNKFGLCNGVVRTADEIKRNKWLVIRGWVYG